MKRKIIIYVATILCLTFCSFALAACNVEENTPTPIHTHTFSSKWSTDSSHHWHEATCEHTNEKSDYGVHIDNDNDNLCDTCSYSLPIAAPTTHYVKFDTNGGKFYDGKTDFTLTDVIDGSIIEKPIMPTRDGYDFLGWSRNKYSSVTWDFNNDKVSSNLTLYALWNKVFVRDSEIQTYTEQQKRNNTARLYSNDFNNNPSYELSEKEVAQAIEDKKLTIGKPIEGKKAVYKKRSVSYGIDDLSYWGANDNITYVGSLLKMNNQGTELAPIIGLERKPLTLSLNLEGATGISYSPVTVDNVSLSSISQAINSMVKDSTGENAQLPFIISAQLTEIKAQEEINAALGLSFNVGRFFNFSSEFNFSDKGTQTYALLTLKQIYFKVTADYDAQQGAYSLLSDKTTKTQLQNACGDYCPVYVSSVSYGRIAAITLKTEMNFKELNAQITTGTSLANGKLDAMADVITKNESINYNWFVYGGSTSGNQEVLNGDNIHDMIRYLNQPYDPAKQVGLPISYQLSFIADNSSAKIGFVGDYYYCEYIDIDNTPSPTENKKISITKSFDTEKKIIDGLKINGYNYDAYGALSIADFSFIRVDISELDLEYIRALAQNIEIKIELNIKEVDDGYQEIYVYNSGVKAKDVQERRVTSIAQVELEHGVGYKNTNYSRYCLTAVISPDSITSNELWIAFDAWGKDNDTWYAKDFSISLSKTDKNIQNMYAIKYV